MGHVVLFHLTLAHIVPVLRPVLCLCQRLGLGPPRDGGVHLVGVDALAQHLVRREERLQARQLRSFVEVRVGRQCNAHYVFLQYTVYRIY